jgi:hypothetical protein
MLVPMGNLIGPAGTPVPTITGGGGPPCPPKLTRLKEHWYYSEENRQELEVLGMGFGETLLSRRGSPITEASAVPSMRFLAYSGFAFRKYHEDKHNVQEYVARLPGRI